MMFANYSPIRILSIALAVKGEGSFLQSAMMTALDIVGARPINRLINTASCYE